MLLYANADIVRREQDQAPLRFVQFWRDLTGLKPDWLYFDSRMTTYSVLDQLRQDHISFIPIRRRGAAVLQALRRRPAADWTAAVLDTPQRRHQRLRYLDGRVALPHNGAHCRQVAADGLGRATPTLFLTNNEQVSGRAVIRRYIQRNSIEDERGLHINFFHLDCLASAVRLNVNLDVVLTVLANGCYLWLGQRLPGCAATQPKLLYCRFVETGGRLAPHGWDLLVSFDRRSPNPLLAQAFRDQEPTPAPGSAQNACDSSSNERQNQGASTGAKIGVAGSGTTRTASAPRGRASSARFPWPHRRKASRLPIRA